MTKTSFRAQIGPEWSTFGPGNIDSAIRPPLLLPLSAMAIRKIRQIESENLKKTDKTISQAHIDPK